MFAKYGDRVDFVTVYIREAHPEDEWQMPANEKEGVCYPQPKTTEARLRIANDFVARFKYPIPMLVDRIENPADAIYAGWPERLYVVDGGVIVFKGGLGPWKFHPEEVEAWLGKRFPGGA